MSTPYLSQHHFIFPGVYNRTKPSEDPIKPNRTLIVLCDSINEPIELIDHNRTESNLFPILVGLHAGIKMLCAK